mgnify:CR=1 FL=1
MATIFLTSNLNCYDKSSNISTQIDNTNHFVDELKKELKNIKKIVYICSSPENFEKTDLYSSILTKSFKIDGFGVEDVTVVDNRFTGDLKQEIISADLVFLMGGHCPTQLAYFKKINLSEILKHYQGVIIGQSAGSMDMAKLAYIQPESEEEFRDKNFKKQQQGLGLIDFNIMPHMNRARVDEIDGATTFDMCVQDSATFPHYGIYDGGFIKVKNNQITAFGKTLLFKNKKCYKLCDDLEICELKGDYSENKINNTVLEI